MNSAHGDFLQSGPPRAVSDRMRELLARAAQDHLYEQQSHDSSLEELRRRLEGLEWLLRDTRERELSGLATQIAAQVAALEAVRAAVAALADRPPPWAEALAEQIALAAEQAKPVGELPALRAEVDRACEGVDDALGRLRLLADASQQATNVVDGLGQRIDRLQQSMDAAATRFGRLDKALAEAGQHAAELEAITSALRERTDYGFGELSVKVEQGLAGLSGRVEGTTGRLDGLDGRFEGVQGRLDGLDGRVEGVQGRLDGMDGRIAAFDERIGTVNHRLDALPATLETGELRQRLAALSDRLADDRRVDDLGSALAGLGADLSARPDHDAVQQTMATVVESAHGDLVRRLSGLEDTVLALAEALLRPGSRDDGRAAALEDERPVERPADRGSDRKADREEKSVRPIRAS